ncbi:MAG TPA: hypothetical protein VGD96_24185 [Bradyrhizobium sp.]
MACALRAEAFAAQAQPLQDIDLIADPGRNFKVIMKDGKIYKNTLGRRDSSIGCDEVLRSVCATA